jgi:hypothetical protein
MNERVYKLASALLATSPDVRVEQALTLAEMITRLMIELEEFKHEACEAATPN